MTDTTALQALADKVEAGDDTAHHHAAAFPSESAYGHCTWHDSHKASGGSLDAAKALQEAVLPGWHGSFSTDGFARVAKGGNCLTVMESCRLDDQPARAWLLAIIRALIAGGRDANS